MTDRTNTAASTLRVLFVEDSDDDVLLIVRQLERSGYRVETHQVQTPDGFDAAIDNAQWDVVISDHSMPHFSSVDALAAIKARGIDCPFIIVSGTIGEDAAVDAMRAGAHDYVLKNNLVRLAPAIERELNDAELRRQAREERQARKAIERQLQEAQKMEAVGRLAGGIAHDFNNLLTAILGFSSLALDRLASNQGRFEIEQVKQAAERAARFTRQLLAFSRQQVMSPRLIDPVEAVTQMVPMLQQLMGEDVQLETVGTAGAARVKVDPGQFEQVIMNLAVNARDAMPHGGAIRIAVFRTDLSLSNARRLQLPSGPYVTVETTDTGTGMDASTRARIFEPFFTTKPPGKGTGLGLSTVYGILQQSGGGIDVDSEVDRGSTFRVYLPFAAGTDVARSAPGPVPPAALSREGTVLVAEDEESVRALIRAVLTNAGFRVFEAASGTEARALVQSLDRPIDLLITDVVMPGLVGPDLARIVLARFPQTRVLYITGYATHSSVPAGFFDEGDVLMLKPFLPEQLLAKVQERLHGAS
jgi:two-component system, cell cycle sensor histidine kinase and response regulator CckA